MLVLAYYWLVHSIHRWIRDISVLGTAMIKLDLTSEQIDSLLKTNFAHLELARDIPVFRGDTVIAAERECHVTAVTDNPHCVTRAVYLRMGR